MALILGSIYEETRQRFQLTLAAGEAGLRSPVKWVYVAEDYTTADFLRGGELIITIQRGSKVIIPNGDTLIQENDMLTIHSSQEPD